MGPGSGAVTRSGSKLKSCMDASNMWTGCCCSVKNFSQYVQFLREAALAVQLFELYKQFLLVHGCQAADARESGMLPIQSC